MKKFWIAFIFSLCNLFVTAQEKNDFTTALNQYFKASPFQKDPVEFVTETLTDNDFMLDTLIKKTDTTLFFMQGYYKTFNPFGSNFSKAQLQIYYSLIGSDTTIVYSIIGIADANENDKINSQKKETAIYKSLHRYFTKVLIKTGTKKKPYTRHSYYFTNYPVLITGYGKWRFDESKYAVSVILNITLAASAVN